jgi:serine/threonine protein kinase
MPTEDPTEKSPLPSGEGASLPSPPPVPPPPPRKSERPGGLESLVGRTISGRYQIEKVLGEGGMGIVYAAEHLHIRKRVAVKILHPEMSRLPEVVARFEREAMAAAHIEHPNVAAATDFGKLDDGSFFLVLEYLEGGSLREVIAAGRLPVPRALHIMGQIAGALGRAGAMGIVHRDLKPENVMLIVRDGDPDFVKVLDFGIAKVPVEGLTAADVTRGPAQPVLTQLGMVYGTPEYMAPEQALGQAVDVRADLYALGIITYEMLTGVRPFEHESKVTLLGMHVTAPVPAMAKKAPEADVPKELEAIVGRLLAKEASSRFADAKELMDAVSGLAASSRIDAPPLDRGSGSSLRGGLWERASLALPRESPLSKVPSKAWAIGAAGLGGLLFLVFFAKALAGGGTTPRPGADAEAKGNQLTSEREIGGNAKAPSAVDEQVALAERTLAEGDSASAPTAITILTALEQTYPDRPDVHRDLERAYASVHDTKSMLGEAQRWIAVDPAGAAGDRRLADDLRAVLLGKDDVDAALALLEHAMGPSGVDVLYDVAFGAKPQAAIAVRARQALTREETRSRASPAALVAIDLQHATKCEEKRALLPRATDVGDARSVAILSGFTPMAGCGFLHARDCWPCLHRDGTLQAAISAITTRLNTNP